MALETGGATTNSEYDAMLKDYYEGGVRTHVENKVTILSKLEKSKRKWNGRQVTFPLHLGRNQGVGARAEGAQIPAAGEQEYVESKIRAKFQYGRISLTGPVMAASQGDRGAFASALTQEIKGMRNDLRNDMNRQCWGVELTDATAGGNSGVLATVSTGQAPGTEFACDNDVGVRYLRANMNVVVGTPGASSLSNDENVTITAVDASAKTFTIASTTVATDDVVVRGDGNGNSYTNEITGLATIIEDSDNIDLQTVDVSANTLFKAHVEENGGIKRDLSLELMQLALDACDEKGGEEPNLIMGHHSMRREYINLLTSDVRYAPEQMRAGFKTLTYAGGNQPIPIVFDKHAPYHRLYFINTGDIKQYVMKDWGWADRDGAILNRESDKDSWEAFMCWYGNLGCEVRNTHAVISDLNASNLIF